MAFSEDELSTAEALLTLYLQKYNLKEATAVAKRTLSTERLREAVDELVRRRLQRSAAVAWRDISMATRRDQQEAPWYAPDPDGVLWSQLRKKMEESGLRKSLDAIDASSDAVVSQLAEPFSSGDKRKGLVIGNVQSGKTANYASVIAKCVDAKYKMVIVLSGIHNNLRSQTQSRLEHDLEIASPKLNWFRLTTADEDFGKAEAKNANATAAKHDRIIAVVKKYKNRLENLRDFLLKVDGTTLAQTPILIIDDESDQAAPDSGPEDDPTTINRLIREIWALVDNGSYVGYTATPFANVFINPNLPAPGSNEDMYPSDFIHVMPTPAAYFGAERIFGIDPARPDSADSEASQRRSGLDVVRLIPDTERDSLVPPTQAEAKTFEPVMTQSLSTAIKWFIIAAAVRRLRGDQQKHSTMLVHTTHYTFPHFATRTLIDEFLTDLRRKARDGDVSDFRAVFDDEIDRERTLYRGEGPPPIWTDVAREIASALRAVVVAVDNGRAEPEDRLRYPDDDPLTVIVVGGGTLSRGLTLEGLFVSYFMRSSETYDTLLQMGRWFGYRPGYEDLQRIWVSDGLQHSYRFLALVEAEVRAEVKRMIDSGQKPADIGLRIRQHPGRLQITNPNKMKHTDRVEVDFEGYRLQTYKFDVSEDGILTRNLEAAKRLIASIAPHGVETSGGRGRARLFTEVPLDIVRHFVEGFEQPSPAKGLHLDAMKWAAAKLPEATWNVVIASGAVPATTLEETGFPVAPVNRAPIRDPDSAQSRVLNLGTLMSGDDRVMDLKLQGVALRTSQDSAGDEGAGRTLTTDEQRLWRRSSNGANGRGLLIVYPISRNSTSQEAGVRMAMRDALAGVSPTLVRDDEQTPLIGMGVVMPYDVDGVLKEKGNFIAVTPELSDEDEGDREALEYEDREGDYGG